MIWIRSSASWLILFASLNLDAVFASDNYSNQYSDGSGYASSSSSSSSSSNTNEICWLCNKAGQPPTDWYAVLPNGQTCTNWYLYMMDYLHANDDEWYVS